AAVCRRGRTLMASVWAPIQFSGPFAAAQTVGGVAPCHPEIRAEVRDGRSRRRRVPEGDLAPEGAPAAGAVAGQVMLRVLTGPLQVHAAAEVGDPAPEAA